MKPWNKLIALLLVGLLLVAAPLSAADLTITAGSVTTTSTQLRDVTAGATITAGQVVYLDASASDVAKLADNDASATTNVVAGIALHGASSGQPLRIITGGTITIGATVAVGTIYVLSSTAGAICPAADLASGDYTSIIGVATSTTVITLSIKNSGVQVP